MYIESGTTDDIIRHIEAGRINLGFIRPVENIGSPCFFSIAHERYLLAVAKESPLSARSELDLEDLRSEKIISFSRQNRSYSKRYFAEKFEEHDLTDNVTCTCDDTFSAGLGIGFVPEWTQDLPSRSFELKKVRGVDFKIGIGVAWNREDPIAARDDIVDIARSWLGRAGDGAGAFGDGRLSCSHRRVPPPKAYGHSNVSKCYNSIRFPFTWGLSCRKDWTSFFNI